MRGDPSRCRCPGGWRCYRSRGGGDKADNIVAACAFHHLRCIHGGHLSVTGRAPDGLTWLLRGRPFTGA